MHCDRGIEPIILQCFSLLGCFLRRRKARFVVVATSALEHIEGGGCSLETDTDCVPAFALDEMFPTERIHVHVLFLKIDVQTKEMGVLRGARQMPADQRAQYLWVEYTHDREIIPFLAENGYM